MYKISLSFGKKRSLYCNNAYTRAICNNPKVCGIEYTKLLQKACTEILKMLPIEGVIEADAIAANILCKGLNF